MKILISAFPTFSNLEKNPSEELLKVLKSKTHELVKVLIPVEWDTAFAVLDRKINEENPDAIIMLGAAGRDKFSFENVAKNYRKLDSIDNQGNHPDTEEIVENGPKELHATLNPRNFLGAFNAINIPSEISSDAGSYLCNETFYKCLYYHSNTPSIFIHIPTKIDLDKALKYGSVGFDFMFECIL